MKRGKLSKVEKCYIDNNFNTLTTSAIAIDLDRPEDQIVNYLNSKEREQELPVDTATSQPIPKPNRPKGISAADMMGRRFGSDGSVVAVTLTPGASQKLDDVRGSMSSKMGNQEHIFRPLPPETLKKRRKNG